MPAEREVVPIRILIAGYAFTLLVAILGCLILARSRHADRGVWWAVGAFSSALITMLLFVGIGVLPDFFTIVVANEGAVLALVLLHQAVVSVLGSPRRHIRFGILLVVLEFALCLYFTYRLPSIEGRALVRVSLVGVQVAMSAFVLFRHKGQILRYEARVAGYVFASFVLLQISQITANKVWTPSPDRLHPQPVQAFFHVFDFMVGMACCFAVVWLALCEKRQDLQMMATTDGLTGLLNRTAFDEILKRELRLPNRRRRPLALLLIDIDHFKAINDQYGHQAGDEVIRRISGLLRDNVRSIDSVARYGGEEFAVLLDGMGSDQAEVTAERLRLQIKQMAAPPQFDVITASIGIAVRRESDTPESLFKRSDEAMYLSKRLGRNRVSALEYTYEEL